MRKSYIKRFCLIAPIILLAFSIVSCSSTKNTKYFQDIPDSGRLKLIHRAEYIEPKIQVDDILTVVVQTLDPQSSSLVNTGNVTGGSVPTISTTPIPTPNLGTPLGYLVDKDGAITIPILGKVKVEGLTTFEAKEAISKVASIYYKDASVIVRYANFKINVGGEVSKPGTYIMPNEKVSILDAITMAGDLTIFGKRDNVLLIRENADGTKTPYRINLKKSDFMSSPYFYLRQNDYVYVEPAKGKAASTDASAAKNYTIIASALSVIIVLISRL